MFTGLPSERLLSVPRWLSQDRDTTTMECLHQKVLPAAGSHYPVVTCFMSVLSPCCQRWGSQALDQLCSLFPGGQCFHSSLISRQHTGSRHPAVITLYLANLKPSNWGLNLIEYTSQMERSLTGVHLSFLSLLLAEKQCRWKGVWMQSAKSLSPPQSPLAFQHLYLPFPQQSLSKWQQLSASPDDCNSAASKETHPHFPRREDPALVCPLIYH